MLLLKKEVQQVVVVLVGPRDKRSFDVGHAGVEEFKPTVGDGLK